MNKLIITSTLLSLFFLSQNKAYANNNCFENIELAPSFIAFKTHRKSTLGQWYQQTFGLTVAKSFQFPDGSAHGVLMNKKDFIVEVFYRDDIKKSNDSLSIQKGVMKFGIFTNANLVTLKACLLKSGVKAGRIFKDENLNINLLSVKDPENNSIEIIARQ